MGKSWALAPVGGSGAGSSHSWRRRPRTPGPSSSSAGDDSTRAEIVISSGDEEDQQPPQPQYAAAVPGHVYAGMDAEFEEQMEMILLRFVAHTTAQLRHRECSSPRSQSGIPTTLSIAPQTWRPNRTPCQGGATVAAAPTHQRGAALATARRAVKEERRSPPPQHVVKEERRSPPSLPKARGRILHYLRDGGSSSSSQSAMTTQKYADWEQRRRNRRNASRRSQCADSDVPPPHIAADEDLAYAWALDRSVTTSETAKRRLRRLDGEIVRYGEE